MDPCGNHPCHYVYLYACIHIVKLYACIHVVKHSHRSHLCIHVFLIDLSLRVFFITRGITTDLVDDAVPRLLINREVVGEAAPGSRRGFDFSDDSRDGAFVGDCDDAVRALVQLLGWEAELQALVEAGPRSRV